LHAPEQQVSAARCGQGRARLLYAYMDHDSLVTPFVASEVGLEKARRLASARGVEGEWIAADLLEYRPQPHTFDLVLVLYL
jgi:hypothetical protein